MVLLFVVNSGSFFLSHRLPLAVAARDAGFEVHVATGPGPEGAEIKAYGFFYYQIPLSRSGTNPLQEIRCIYSLILLFRKIKPRLIHLVTIKPVVYGGIIARLMGVPAVVAAISGLGSVFVEKSRYGKWLSPLMLRLYRVALKHENGRVIFQNESDRSVLIEGGAIEEAQAVLIRGSGVELTLYSMTSEPPGVPVVSFASRLLKQKGVNEFVDAAQRINQRGINCRFWLIGEPDPGNPSSISYDEFEHLKQRPYLEVLGFRTDIPELLSASSLVVLPSYYGEGLPKILIEAAACGRAVVTTDHPGCRDAVVPDVTGSLVPVQDSQSLAEAIEYLVLDPVLRKKMGVAGRRLAESEFDVRAVVETHLKLYNELRSCT